MYVYSLPPIDFFDGLIPLDKYSSFFDDKEILNFLLDALRALFKHGVYWSMDTEGAEIYIGAIPSLCNYPFKFALIKQSESGGNGLTYAVSKIPLSHLKEYQSTTCNTYNEEDQEKFFNFLCESIKCLNNEI